MQYKVKAIQTGIEIEITRYSKTVSRGFKKRPRRNIRKNTMQPELSEDEKKIRHSTSLQKSLCRTKTNLRTLINSNPDCIKFLTLTFADEIYDLNEANPLFMKFIQRFKYRYPGKKYIAVPEFMPISGKVHYHLLLDIPYIQSEKIEKIWGHGFIKIKRLNHVKNMGAYMSKYLTKNNFDERYKSKQKFFYSQNCNKPRSMYGIYAEALHDKLNELTKPIFEKTFKKNKFVGKTKYQVYDIRPFKHLFNPN